MTIFEMEGLTYFYPDAARPALDRVTLSIGEGDFALVTGPAGGGKTTLARAMAGLVPGFFGGRIGGRLLLRGVAVESVGRRRLQEEVGIVLQDPERQTLMTRVDRELSFGAENLGLPPAVVRRRVSEIADCLGIGGILRSRIADLSGGTLQRVALGAVLAAGARALVLDEPTSQLDPVAAEELLSLLARLRDDLDCTIVLVEQRIERCLPMASRVIFMDAGRPRFDGPPGRFCRWAAPCAPDFLPPVPAIWARTADGEIPMTVREGRALLRTSAPFRRPAPAPAPLPGEPVVSLDRVSFSYGAGPAVIEKISIEARRGQVLALLGPNGAGKSTLLKLACGILVPTGGKVSLAGGDPAAMGNRERAALCGYLSQSPGDFLFHDTVEEEIGYTLRCLGRDDRGAAARALGAWGLSDLARRNPRELGGGERQCVAVAAAMAAGPALLLLDEPTRGQDPRMKNTLAGMLAAASSGGAAVVAVTQDLEFAAECAGRIVLLFDGRIAADGPTREIFDGGPFYSPQVSRLFNGFAGGVVTLGDALEALRGSRRGTGHGQPAIARAAPRAGANGSDGPVDGCVS